MSRTQSTSITIATLLLTVLLSGLVAAEDTETQAAPTPKATATPEAKVEQININTATPGELVTLPGIGPKTAQKIVDARPFATLDAILNVKGIGPSKLEKMRRLITIGEEQDEAEASDAENGQEDKPKAEEAEAAPTPERTTN